MGSLPEVRQSLRIVLLGHNPLLSAGIEHMLDRHIITVQEADNVELSAGRGLLLIAPDGADMAQRIRILNLARMVKSCRGWRALNLVDERSERDMRFSRLTGLPVVSLRLRVPELHERLMSVFRGRGEVRRDSVVGLTYRQWETIQSSLEERARQTGGRTMTFYSHRAIALQRIRVKNMHEMRRIVAGCE